MLKLSPTFAKAAATLVGLSFLANPITSVAQDTPAATPPSADQPSSSSPTPAPSGPASEPGAPPAASLFTSDPASEAAQDEAAKAAASTSDARPNPTVTITAPSVTYFRPPAGDTATISADDAQVKVSAPSGVTLNSSGNSWAPVAAASAPSPGFYAGTLAGIRSDAVQKTGENTFDIKVTNAPIQSLLSVLCQTAGHSYTIGSNVDGLATVYLRGISFENALISILRATDQPVTYSQENGVYHFEARRVPRPDEDQQLPKKNVTLDLDNAPFDKALKDLFDYAHASYTMAYNDDKSTEYRVLTSNGALPVSQTAQTAVTMHLHNVPFPAALRALLNATSPALTYSVKDGIIYIRPTQAGYYNISIPQASDSTTYQWQAQPTDKGQVMERLFEQGEAPQTGK